MSDREVQILLVLVSVLWSAAHDTLSDCSLLFHPQTLTSAQLSNANGDLNQEVLWWVIFFHAYLEVTCIFLMVEREGKGSAYVLKFKQMPQNSLAGGSFYSQTMIPNTLLKQQRSFSKLNNGQYLSGQSLDLNAIEHAFNMLKRKCKVISPQKSWRWLQYRPGRTSPETPSTHQSQSSSSPCIERICSKILSLTSFIYITLLYPEHYGSLKWGNYV